MTDFERSNNLLGGVKLISPSIRETCHQLIDTATFRGKFPDLALEQLQAEADSWTRRKEWHVKWHAGSQEGIDGRADGRQEVDQQSSNQRGPQVSFAGDFRFQPFQDADEAFVKRHSRSLSVGGG